MKKECVGSEQPDMRITIILLQRMDQFLRLRILFILLNNLGLQNRAVFTKVLLEESYCKAKVACNGLFYTNLLLRPSNLILTVLPPVRL